MARLTAPILGLLVALTATTVIAQSCSGTARVNIDVVYTWVPANETTEAQFPPPGHFSGAVCALSRKPALFVPGSSASPGFVSVAETGATGTLLQELRNNPDVVKVESTPSLALGESTGRYNVKFTATSTASYVACVSMIAPSPDWVVGLTSFDLCDSETGSYVAKEERLMRAYDAGSDSGATYVAPNQKTTPQGTIGRATEGVIEHYGYVRVTTQSTNGMQTTSGGTGGTRPPVEAPSMGSLNDGTLVDGTRRPPAGAPSMTTGSGRTPPCV